MSFTIGCGGSATSPLRTNTPGEAAAAALQLYDSNTDGKIAGEELNKCPGFVDALSRIDANGDKAIDAAELEARFVAHDNMSDLVAFDLHIFSDGAPLGGAAVSYIPEPFMGEGKQSYVGTSTETGSCPVDGETTQLPGVPTGFYKVQIVHQATGVDVTRGCEVADDSPTANRMAFDVKNEASRAPGGGR